MPQVGYRFYPTEQELLGYFLYNKITENPILYEDGDIPVRCCDLYGSEDPSVIWNSFGGNHLLEGQTLYLFTRLKKLSPKSKRFNRKIGSGAWQGENGATPIVACGSDQLLGSTKRYRYESRKNPTEDGRWLMFEFSINPCMLGQQYSNQEPDLVLCGIKKNESGRKTEKPNVDKKQQSNKRKLKESEDQSDEGVANKRLRSAPEEVLVQQNHSSSCTGATVRTLLDSEEKIEALLPDDSPTSDTEGFLCFLDEIVDHDSIEDGEDGSVQKHLQKTEEEEPFVQQLRAEEEIVEPFLDEAFDLDVDKIWSGIWLDESLVLDLDKIWSDLDEIPGVDFIEDHDEECVQSKKLQGLDEPFRDAEFDEFLKFDQSLNSFISSRHWDE